MRPRISASILWATVLLVPAFFVTSSTAQVNGTPSSVTSQGFGGRQVNGAPSSVTSLGPRGYAPNFRAGTPGRVPFLHQRGTSQHRRRRDGDFFTSPLYYAVPVPYAVDAAPPDEGYAGDDAEYQGGPTVFDRRGSGERSYVPPAKEAAPSRQPEREDTQAQESSVQSEPEPAVPTMLVFKDGHKLEVGNYAIVGSTLFDLTAGHSRKIALAQLNLDATQKENEDRGVLFQVPPGLKTN